MAKKYIPNDKEKYMCEKHKTYFKKRLIEWKNEIISSKFIKEIGKLKGNLKKFVTKSVMKAIKSKIE